MKYRVYTHETWRVPQDVEANSPEEAKAKVADGDSEPYDDITLLETNDPEEWEVTEI